MKCCDACGKERDEEDLATIEYKSLTFHYCHGMLDPAPTCYMMAALHEDSRRKAITADEALNRLYGPR